MEALKTQKAEKTREKILRTAVRIFSKNGFYGTRVDEVAAKANVNKERIYAYFGSKSALFECSLAKVYSDSAEQDAALLELSSADIAGMTKKIVAHYMATYQKHPEFWRMIAWANLEFSSRLSSISEFKSESLEHIRKLFREGQKKGIFSTSLSFDAYIYGLWALTFFYHSNRKTLEESLSPEIFRRGFEAGPLAGLPALFEARQGERPNP